VDLYLHIGSTKTGTTTLQEFLATNRALLASLGYLYPRSLGAKRHNRLSLFAQTDRYRENTPFWNRKMQGVTITEFRERCRAQWLNEVERSALDKMILSDEALLSMPREAIARLRALLHDVGGRIHLICYLRRQDDHVVSLYQQEVKSRGETRTLGQWLAESDRRKYDYAQRLAMWHRCMDPHSISVRPFERCELVGGSLLTDFLDCVGIDRPEADFAAVTRRNETLDAEAVELIRLLNIHRARYVELLARKSPGPTLTLPDDVLDAFMKRWEPANRTVAQTYLGREDGVLFRLPRKTHNTTTVQHLDPERCQQLLQELRFPPRAHRQVQVVMRQLGRPMAAPAAKAAAQEAPTTAKRETGRPPLRRLLSDRLRRTSPRAAVGR
jgi:hypothetical protein